MQNGLFIGFNASPLLLGLLTDARGENLPSTVINVFFTRASVGKFTKERLTLSALLSRL